MKKFRQSRTEKNRRVASGDLSSARAEPGSLERGFDGSEYPDEEALDSQPAQRRQLRSIYDDDHDDLRPSGGPTSKEQGSFRIRETVSAAMTPLKALRFKRKPKRVPEPPRTASLRVDSAVRSQPIPESFSAPASEMDLDESALSTPALARPTPANPASVKPTARKAPKQKKRQFSDEDGWLVAQNLAKSFRRRPVVRDVTLAVRQGEAVGLLGPNGAGKTTVFYMITGLIRPDQGAIRIDGFDVTSLPMYSRARLGIGYLPQEASIFRGLSVEDNIKAVLEIVEPDRRQRKQDLERLLQEFGIDHLRNSPSIALSGGERRRCEIARALASRPAFMLLDEPFAGIDPIAVGDIQKLVRQLTARGIGVLITDHNVRETLGLIDRAYIIHSGEVLMEGTPEDIVQSEDVRRVYLGDQFTL